MPGTPFSLSLSIYLSIYLSISRYARTFANEFFYGSVSDSMAAKIAPHSLIFDMKSGKGQYLVGTRDRLSHSRFTDFPPGPDKKGGQPTVKIPGGTSINSRKYFAREHRATPVPPRLFRHTSRARGTRCAIRSSYTFAYVRTYVRRRPPYLSVLAEQRVETFTFRVSHCRIEPKRRVSLTNRRS